MPNNRQEIGSSTEGPRVLVAFNDTERSVLAVRRAMAINEARGGTLRITTIGFPPGEKHGAPPTAQTLRDKVASLVGAPAKGTEFTVTPFAEHHADLEYGRAVALADEAQHFRADLLVIGEHDQSKRNTISGTLTERLMRYVPCPVLIAKNEAARPYRLGLVAVDFSAVSETLVEAGLAWVPEGELHLVHALEEGEDEGEADRRLRSFSAACAEKAQGQTRTDDLRPQLGAAPAQKAISEAAAKVEPDLLVIGTRGRSVLARLLLGSVAFRFLSSPPCDVLVVRSPQT
jgi:nucleotide-binding universal stress UspA family protein